MPELPEVEAATRIARRACKGKVIAAVTTLHPSPRRHFPDNVAITLVGDRVVRVWRRGKHQLIGLQSGRTLHVHFRMTGDWRVTRTEMEPESFGRVLFDFDDGTRLVLQDARALAVVSLHAAGDDPLPDLGPEATAASFNGDWLTARLEGRRTPIKPLLLDQQLVAGIGNIYASEALWYAKVDPRRGVDMLGPASLAAVVAGVKRAMQKALAHPERYRDAQRAATSTRFNVYDREGSACRRCRTPIARIIQAGRSTYFCPGCQR